MARRLLSGNEALAYGAWAAGLKVAAAYPGTPSTEVLETLARFPEVRAEWSTNEKVAYEVAYGAALGGVRSLVAMKHVGLNVAADPFFSSAYAGVNAGFVVIVADDPGMHSSQNEQDSRRHAKAARVPVLEPSDPAEAYLFVQRAFEISERFDLPVMVRMTTRVSHGKGVVEPGERQEVPPREYRKDMHKYVMVPANARVRHRILEEEKLPALRRFSDTLDLHRLEPGDPEKLAFVTSGVAYHYVREVFPDHAVLKLGLSWPLPERLLAEFFGTYPRVMVVEEGDPVIEEELKALGYSVEGKNRLPRYGEMDPSLLRARILGSELPHPEPRKAVSRPPALCPGCPYTGVFWSLSLLKKPVMGDIGCYTLGALPPFQAMDTTIDMGASIPMAFGMEKAGRQAVAVIGDSTFFHSGVAGLIDLVYNRGHSTVIILENNTTGMTGHQGHPGSGKALQDHGHRVDVEQLVRAIGVEHVQVVDPHDLKATKRAISEAIRHEGPSVVIARRPCALIPEGRELYREEPVRWIDPEVCVGARCHSCLRVGCPAISVDKETGKPYIVDFLCVGCGVCEQTCPYDAIHPVD